MGEECTEVIIGSKNSREEAIYEISDLAYHVLVLMVELGISLEDIKEELANRKKCNKNIIKNSIWEECLCLKDFAFTNRLTFCT